MRNFLLSIAISLMMVHGALAAGDSILRPGHPERYIVKKGDTLWDISSMFLTDAWRWPEIWYVNPEIENPHLIYPGDIILLRFVEGQPQLSVERGETARTTKLSPPQAEWEGDRNVKMEPSVRASPLRSAIPAIPLDAIASLLMTGRIVERRTLERAPYVLAGVDERLVFGPSDRFYGRGRWTDDTSVYGVFRKGEVYQDPDTREILGFEAREIGSATVEARNGNIYTFALDSVSQDVRIGDRLLPTEERRVDSTFFPAAPDRPVEGVILTVLGGVTQVGRNDVVTVNRGLREGIDVGHVLAIYKRGAIVRDRVTRGRVRLPSERAGLLMIFRTFEKMSYALVLQTKEPLHVDDIVQNP